MLHRILKWILRKICSLPVSLHSCLKDVFHWILTIFYLPKPRKIIDGRLLPLENPATKPSDDHPSLEQHLLNSKPDAAFPSYQSLEQNIHEYPREKTKNTPESVTIYIPNYSYQGLDLDIEYEETIRCISTGEILEESSDQNQEYPTEIKNIVHSVTISKPNFTNHYLDYYASSSTDNTHSAVIIQKNNVPQKIDSYPEEIESECKKVIKESAVVVEKPRRIKHYSSNHRILLVGEGDFSFSCSLAVAFGCASKMVATSLDSKGTRVAVWEFESLEFVESSSTSC